MTEIYDTDYLAVCPWECDSDDKRLTYDPRSLYVETFWLPILGPSSIFFLRFASRKLSEANGEDRLLLDLKEVARCIGLAERTGHNSPIARTLARCVDFHMAQRIGVEEIRLRKRLPILSTRHLQHLPASLQERHKEFERSAYRDKEATNSPVQRGRRLALSLLNLGEESDLCEYHLLRWGFHPSLAHESVVWAGKQLGRFHSEQQSLHA